MLSYAITFKRSASKELSKLPKRAVIRITDAIDGLAEEPRPRGCKKLRGLADRYRIKIGDYRVVYSIEDDILTVEILRIADRKDAYR